MKIDIGGGTLCAPGYCNVDPIHGDSFPVGRPGDDYSYTADLHRRIQDGLPLPDGCVEAARASHVLEHVPAGQERVDAMNEVWRLLRPGAEFETVVPVVGYTGEHVDVGVGADHLYVAGPHYSGWQPWADPTHVSYWWYPESWWYFTGGPNGAFRANADYDIKYWEWSDGWLVDGWEAHVTLVKPS